MKVEPMLLADQTRTAGSLKEGERFRIPGLVCAEGRRFHLYTQREFISIPALGTSWRRTVGGELMNGADSRGGVQRAM
jgi:hypothetical protein